MADNRVYLPACIALWAAMLALPLFVLPYLFHREFGYPFGGLLP